MDSVQVGQLVTLDLWIRSPTSFEMSRLVSAHQLFL